MDGRKVRIAYVCTPITFGGSEKVSLNFLKAVNKEIYQVRPVLLVRPWEDATYFARELQRYGFKYDVIPTRMSPGQDPLRVPRVAMKIYSLLGKGSFDIVHSHGYFANICALPVAKFMGIKRMSTCHGFISNNRKLDFYNKLDMVALRLSNRVICVSGNLKDTLIAAGLSPNKIRVITNAVSIDQDRRSILNTRAAIRKSTGVGDSDLVIGYAGRLSEEKGLKTLMHAFGRVIQGRPGCRLWLVGDGVLRPDLEKMADAAGISDRVVFFGFREDVASLMMGMDVFALPSLTEGTPLALLEAMSLGVPSVASAVGQIPKIIISGENGLLVDPGDVLELTQAIQQVLDNKSSATLLSENARQTIENSYSVGAWARRIENVYSEL